MVGAARYRSPLQLEGVLDGVADLVAQQLQALGMRPALDLEHLPELLVAGRHHPVDRLHLDPADALMAAHVLALEVLEAARARRPADRRLLYAVATISRDAGNVEAALGYARALRDLRPGDPAAAALVRELEAARE